jgi:hypothetical protein
MNERMFEKVSYQDRLNEKFAINAEREWYAQELYMKIDETKLSIFWIVVKNEMIICNNRTEFFLADNNW